MSARVLDPVHVYDLVQHKFLTSVAGIDMDYIMESFYEPVWCCAETVWKLFRWIGCVTLSSFLKTLWWILVNESVACGPFTENSWDWSIGFNVLGIPLETNKCLASNLHRDCDVHPWHWSCNWVNSTDNKSDSLPRNLIVLVLVLTIQILFLVFFTLCEQKKIQFIFNN